MPWNSAAAESRDRMLIAAIWIISLGSVFLIQHYFGRSWTAAWPLWVLFVGVGSLGSAILGRARSAFGIWGIWWPLAILVVGAVLLLSTTGNLAMAPRDLIGLWPAAVIAIGVWFLIGAVFARPNASADSQKLSIPVTGLSEAWIKLNFGAGELGVGQAEPGQLVSGTFDGGVRQTTHGVGRLELPPFADAWPIMWSRPMRWNVGLTSEIPLSLELHTGANRSTINLSALRIPRLEVHTGASETRVRLPGSGATAVRAEAGVASLTLEVPRASPRACAHEWQSARPTSTRRASRARWTAGHRRTLTPPQIASRLDPRGARRLKTRTRGDNRPDVSTGPRQVHRR